MSALAQVSDPWAFSPTQFRCESDYMDEYFKDDTFINASFVVCGANKTFIFAPTHVVNGQICYNNDGAPLFGATGDKKLLRAVFDEFDRIAAATQARALMLNDAPAAGGVLSPIGAEAYNRGGAATARLCSLTDLTQTEEEIHRALRKRYKSLINLGRRELDWRIMSSDAADPELWERFRRFHVHVAGRETRPRRTWDLQFEQLRAGCSEVTLGYLEGDRLVSSCITVDQGALSIYSIAAYDRDLFDSMPLAHANVYEAMMRAKARGQKAFRMGDVPMAGVGSEKEVSIGRFKKGFCADLRLELLWRAPLTPGTDAAGGGEG